MGVRPSKKLATMVLYLALESRIHRDVSHCSNSTKSRTDSDRSRDEYPSQKQISREERLAQMRREKATEQPEPFPWSTVQRGPSCWCALRLPFIHDLTISISKGLSNLIIHLVVTGVDKGLDASSASTLPSLTSTANLLSPPPPRPFRQSSPTSSLGSQRVVWSTIIGEAVINWKRCYICWLF